MRSCARRSWSTQPPYGRLLHSLPVGKYLFTRKYVLDRVRHDVAHQIRQTSSTPFNSGDRGIWQDSPQSLVPTSNGRSTEHATHIKTGGLDLSLPASSNSPKVWVKAIESFFPDHLRREDVNASIQPIHRLAPLLDQARRASNFDVLSHLAIQEGRLDAFGWVASQLIDSMDLTPLNNSIPSLLSTVIWPSQQTLDTFTRTPVSLEDIRSGRAGASRLHPRYLSADAATNDRLHDSVSPVLLSSKSIAARGIRTLIGQLLMSLGKVTIDAAGKEAHVSRSAQSYVIALLSLMHTKGLLPQTLFRNSQKADPSSPQLPPFVPRLSQILSEPPSAALDAFPMSVDGSRESAHTISTRAFEYEPGKLLEYILWCCVQGGWPSEGATIIDEMRKVSGQKRWKSTYRQRNKIHDALKVEHSDQRAYALSERGMRMDDLGEDQAQTGKHTLNADVVVALAHGLVQAISADELGFEVSPAELVQKLHGLQRTLIRDNLSLGSSTWNSLIARIADSLPAHETDKNIRWLELALELATPYASESAVPSAHGKIAGADSLGLLNISSYVLDGTAPILGIYHRIIRTHIKTKDISGALRVLASLQRFTDQNKQKSLKEFFSELKDVEMQEEPAQSMDSASVQRHFPGVHYPVYFPNLPLDVLAGLLDLLQDCDALDLCQWLVYSSDIDGPLIPQESYGNQTIAPSLIRFAVSTSDNQLLRRLMKAQTTAISGFTLLALCQSRIQEGNFESAIETMRLMQRYSLHEWKIVDLVTILKSLMLQIYGRDNTRAPSHPQSRQASELFQKLLRGDLGQVWGASFAELDTLVQILATVDDHLTRLCSNVLPHSQQYAVKLPTESFNGILEGAVKVWGSARGVSLWEHWCQDNADRQLILMTPGDGDKVRQPRSIAEQFSMANSKPVQAYDGYSGDIEGDAEQHPTFAGRIEPTLVTVRAIIQQALQEKGQVRRDATDDPIHATDLEAQADKTLDWASRVLRTEFGLSDAEVGYELKGHSALPGDVIPFSEDDWSSDMPKASESAAA